MERQDIVDQHSILEHVIEKGFRPKASGNEFITNCCPNAEHRDGHNCVNINPHAYVWHCHDCGMGGSIIDWIMKEENISSKAAMELLGGAETSQEYRPDSAATLGGAQAAPAQNLGGGAARGPEALPSAVPSTQSKETETYNYTDENGTLLYQVLRYEPKTFKQRQPKNGDWQWDLQGITRVLYNLPEVLLSKTVCVTEGEKDANNLSALGFCATTTAGGAQSWMPAYAEALKGKDVIIFEDSDAVGGKRGAVILESLQDVAASVKRIRFPGHKDVSDWMGELKAATPEDIAGIKDDLHIMIDKTPHALSPLPIYSIHEMEVMYHEFANSLPKHSFGMGAFSKTLGCIVEQLYPGEMVMIMGDTTQGKTAVMQAIARSASPLSTLFFELELPLETMFERYVQMERGCYGRDVLQGYKDTKGRWADSFKGLQHILICPESGISMDTIEKYITKSELKFGEHPSVVMIDYMGLVRKDFCKSRYEAMAYAAEQAKVVAKRTNTIMFIGSQIGRPPNSKDFNTDPNIHDAKGAGELENSSNLVLTIGRPEEGLLRIKVKKWTRGKKGAIIDFDFDGAKMQITERTVDKQGYAA